MIISIAPMFRLTNHWFRYLIRLMSKHVLLYTEMMTTPALLRGNASSLLYYLPAEHPISAQLAGNDPKDLSICARMVEEAGYDEVNFNVGCPSQRLQAARFGVFLMQSPALIAECVNQMASSIRIPVTVKMRLGIGKDSDAEFLSRFIEQVSQAGCQTFIIHARGTVLENWSTRANRSRLPLDYESIYALQKAFPTLSIILNGGIMNFDQAFVHLKQISGVMIGRAAYKNPYMFIACDSTFYDEKKPRLSRGAVAAMYLDHIQKKAYQNTPLAIKLKPLMGLYHGTPKSSQWRKSLIEGNPTSYLESRC